MSTVIPKLRLLLICSAAIAQGAFADVDTEAQTLVRLSGRTIEYRGVLTEEANLRAFALAASSEHKPKVLLIESKGGSAEAGMQLGAWIFDQALDVSVETFCLSSCANYVFPAGRIKRLAQTATLLWHGGATQPLSDDELRRLVDDTLITMDDRDRAELLRHASRAQLAADLRDSRECLIERERQFFTMLEVDPRIATLGRIDERDVLKPGEHYVGWDYSIEDLAVLGVHDVVVTGDRAWVPAREIMDARIYRLRLDRLPGFVPMNADPE